jgi:hypothetical protein
MPVPTKDVYIHVGSDPWLGSNGLGIAALGTTPLGGYG